MTTTPTTIHLNPDPAIAEQQIEAVIFYLTTCGYIDSEFDLREKAFIRAFLRDVVTARIDAQGPLDPEIRFERIEAQHEHYVERFQEIDRDIKGLLTEAVADGEDPHRFVLSQLKLRAAFFNGICNAFKLRPLLRPLILFDQGARLSHRVNRQREVLPRRPQALHKKCRRTMLCDVNRTLFIRRNIGLRKRHIPHGAS